MAESNSMFLKDRFLMGTFSSNCSGGLSITKVPEKWDCTWDNNLKLGKMLDDAGFDFMLPVARWVGTEGEEITFHDANLETITWSAALLASTKNINIISTIHTAVNHPVALAKQIATMSQIGKKGRIGLNIVAGWHRPEYEALGLILPDNHETRYQYADEWFSIIKRLWKEEKAFDWNGEYFKLKHVISNPRPMGPVPIVNAAGSKEGRDFAIKYADFLFTPITDLARSKVEVPELKEQAARQGRTVDVMTNVHVICRPTEKEALEYFEYIKENTDWTTVDNVVNMLMSNAHSYPREVLNEIRERFALGHGGLPIIGTPEQVADTFTAIHEAGFGGAAISFVNYLEEFPYFRDNVLPILIERGLRGQQIATKQTAAK